jgi:hypothetical protein
MPAVHFIPFYIQKEGNAPAVPISIIGGVADISGTNLLGV